MSKDPASPKLLHIGDMPNAEPIKNGFGNCSLRLWLAITAVVFGGAFQFGYALGVVANTNPIIQSKFNTSDLYISVLVSGNPIGGLIGALLAGYIADRFGRTRGMMFNAIPFVLGSILMAVTPNKAMLVVGRIVVGFGVGVASGITNIFLSEISPVAIRGFVCMLWGVVLTVGTLVALLLSMPQVIGEGDIGWRLVFAFPIIPALYQTIVLIFCPEPPSYLAFNKQDIGAAKVALTKYRNNSVKDEVASLEQEADDSPAVFSMWELLTDPGHRLALVIGIGLHCSQQLSAINAVMSYAPAIFTQANVPDPVLATIGTGLVNVASAAISSLFTDKLGRRLLMLVGLVVISLSHVGLAVSQSCYSTWSCEGDWTGKLAIASVFMFIIGFAGSAGSIPWIIVNEITTPEARGKTNSICVGVNWSLALLILLTYDSIENALGSYTFFIFAAITALGFIFVLLFVPETKKATVQKITQDINIQAQKCPPFVSFNNKDRYESE